MNGMLCRVRCGVCMHCTFPISAGQLLDGSNDSDDFVNVSANAGVVYVRMYSSVHSI